jgi:hypothetical protein
MRQLLRMLGSITILLPCGLSAQQEPRVALPPDYVTARQAPEGKCVVYLYNKSGWTLTNSAQTLKIDDRKVAKLRRDTWSAVVLDPGEHRLVGYETWKPTVFHTLAGETVHWMYAYSPGKSWAQPFAGSPFTVITVPDSVAAPWRKTDQWVAPLVPLPEWVPAVPVDSAHPKPDTLVATVMQTP